MAIRVSHLWRHPIKGHGVEAVERTRFAPGRTMPWDRVWAIAHDAARIDSTPGAWVPCVNFSRGAKSPELMAVRAQVDEARGRVTLTHPRRPAITVDPDDPAGAARLVAWVTPLADPSRPRPSRVVRAEGRGMTDSPFPSLSILSHASLGALSDRLGQPLAMERFRGNIWLEGLAPWEEFGWIGRRIAIGKARLVVRERITRCKATSVNPATGQPDADTLRALQDGWGHQDFGLYAEVEAGGEVRRGDPVTLE